MPRQSALRPSRPLSRPRLQLPHSLTPVALPKNEESQLLVLLIRLKKGLKEVVQVLPYPFLSVHVVSPFPIAEADS